VANQPPDKIAIITTDRINGKETIDAKGHVVAPGFIDPHVHGMDPYGLKLLLRDGVTTSLELEVGAYPVEDFYNQFEGKTQPNYGASVSHAWARMAVLDKINPKGLGMYSEALQESMHDGVKWNMKEYHREDQEAMLAAVEKGLGGVMIGAIDRIGLGKALKLPPHLEIRLVLALGKTIEEMVIETMGKDGNTQQWWETKDIRHVPKRALEDIIVDYPPKG